MEDAPKGRVVRTIDIDYGNLEHTFLFPNLFRFRRWFRGKNISALELRLEFVPGIYLLSELSFDDSDLGVFKLNYIDRLIELDKRRRTIDWAAPAAIINRRFLRPVPDAMLEYLERNSVDIDFDFEALSDSFLAYLEEQSQLTLMSNDNFGLFSSSAESEEEFRQFCMDYANAEKSERALELGAFYDRKIQQILGRLQNQALATKGPKQEVDVALVRDFEMACESLLNKAINLHVTENRPESGKESGGAQYRSTMEDQRKALEAGLERLQGEFREFSSPLIEEFASLEDEVNEKALTITTVEVPLARCTIQLLRVSRVWLPYWYSEYRMNGRDESKVFKAF